MGTRNEHKHACTCTTPPGRGCVRDHTDLKLELQSAKISSIINLFTSGVPPHTRITKSRILPHVGETAFLADHSLPAVTASAPSIPFPCSHLSSFPPLPILSQPKKKVHPVMTSGPSRPAFCTPLPCQFRPRSSQPAQQSKAPVMALEVGQNVRVVAPVTMYHYPGKRNTPVDIEGFEGVILKDISLQDGVEMTATAPYLVQFPDHPRFKAHLSEQELELI